MVVPTGTRTPWRELGEADGDLVVYVRDGRVSGSADLLAEALRIDGLARSLGPAIGIAEKAELETGYVGYLDDGTEVACDANGETTIGEYADSPRECVFAKVNIEA